MDGLWQKRNEPMKRYADDYKVVIKEDEKGREKKTAVYDGKFFDITVDEPYLLKFRRAGMILLALIVIIHVAGGFIANPGMYAFYVAIPYVGAFLPLYYIATGIFRLPKKKRKYRRDEVGLSFQRVKKASLALLILLGIGVIGEIVFMIWFAKESLNLEWIYLGVQAVGAAIVYGLVRYQKPIQVVPFTEEQD